MEECTDNEEFIPLSREDLVELLCTEPSMTADDKDVFRRLSDAIGEHYHAHFHRRLRALKREYAPFDPDPDNTALGELTAQERQKRLNTLYSDFAWMLEQAHFKHLSCEEIEPALDAASHWGIRMDVDFGAFEHIAIFARGDTLQRRTRRRWANLYRLEEADVPIYRRLVLILKLRQHPRLGPNVDTTNVYLKIFKDIPKLDVMMLLPGARVRLNTLDRGRIGLPFLSGIGLAIWNFAREMAENLEAFLTSHGTIWGLAAGGIGYGYKSFFGYQQLKKSYHLTLTQSLYFQNLDSNAGVLTRLLDEAEEQASRRAILAYYCLWRYPGPEGWTVEELETSMELYLDRYADLYVNCSRSEALAQLRTLQLATPLGERFIAVSPGAALEAIGTREEPEEPVRAPRPAPRAPV